MTIKLTEADVEEQYQETEKEELQFDLSDELDITLKYDAAYAEGWQRRICLRDGIYLEVDQSSSRDNVIIMRPEQKFDFIRLSFLLSGNMEWTKISAIGETLLSSTRKRQLHINSNGLNVQSFQKYDTHPWSSVTVAFLPKVLHSFVSSPSRELPKRLRHLVKPSEKEVFRGSRDTQSAMRAALQQILRCPYQGMIKRAYLESKVVELIALVLEHEATIQQGEIKKKSLKPEQQERIYHAKEILLNDLNNPPSLNVLAQQVGLNEFTLRQGFREAFGTTVFAQLQAYRLEIAKQLLAEQDISVADVASRVGYASPSYFSTAFKLKFGVRPKAYQKSCR